MYEDTLFKMPLEVQNLKIQNFKQLEQGAMWRATTTPIETRT
jgi:hypothetical protein